MAEISKQELKEALADQAKVILDAVSEKFDSLEGRISAIETGVTSLNEKLDYYSKSTGMVERKVDEMQAQYASMDERLTKIEDEKA